MMKKTAITLILGLAMVGSAQTPAKPKASRAVVKSAASQKAKPTKLELNRPASGPTIVKVEPRPSQLMMALDVNKDGKLSLKEIKAAVKAFNVLDENKDGELTLNEFGPAPEVVKESRGGGLPVSKPAVKPGAKPSGRPGRRPTARPAGSTKALAGRTPASAKRPSARPTRPSSLSGAKKPTARPGRPVAKAEASSASAKPGQKSAARLLAPNKNRVARKAPARKAVKATRRTTATKDPEIKALIAETKELTEKISKAMGSIRNPTRKQAAREWVRSGSRSLLRELGNGQKANARKKLDEVRKLIPQPGSI